MTSLSLPDLLATLLSDPHCGWSIGSFGAIGEFHHCPDDQILISQPDHLLWVTEKGGIRLDPEALTHVKPIAYEGLSARPHRWTQGMSLCLTEGHAVLNCRKGLTELGPDTDALQDGNQQGILFDMGLEQQQVDFCIRTSDEQLLAILRSHIGSCMTAPDNPAMKAILTAHPHRIVISPIGRVEIYQKIGGEETGGKSPEGPHTHLLPKLLKTGRTHSANTPIPDGLLPCCILHPASPVAGQLGEDIPFDSKRFETFQSLLSQYGPASYLHTKAAVRRALETGLNPEKFELPSGRLARTALRNTLRQTKRQLDALAQSDVAPNLLKLWIQQFDPAHADAE